MVWRDITLYYNVYSHDCNPSLLWSSWQMRKDLSVSWGTLFWKWLFICWEQGFLTDSDLSKLRKSRNHVGWQYHWRKLHDDSENKLISIKLIVKGHGWSHFCPGKRPYTDFIMLSSLYDWWVMVFHVSSVGLFSNKFTTKTHGICRVYVLSLSLIHFKVLLTQTHVMCTQ